MARLLVSSLLDGGFEMTEKPIRLQISRAKDFDLQAASIAANGLPAVNVARPSKWGNPYRVGDMDPVICSPMSAEAAVFWFKADLDPLVSSVAAERRGAIREALAGKNLACWCKPGQLCHADVLLELANALICEQVKP
jgi:hypothetical protein